MIFPSSVTPRRAWCACALLATVVMLGLPALVGAPVALRFSPPESAAPALARAISAEVRTPSGKSVLIPAFPIDETTWEVRARAEVPGEYRLGQVVEIVGETTREIAVQLRSERSMTVPPGATSRPSVRRDPADPTRFVQSTGERYTPIGANLAWAPDARVEWHLDAFRQFAVHDLNWTRLWMCHWGATNLDWLPEAMGPSPKPGALDPRIADRWDQLLAAAEEHGVYAQVVLQHHGQYTTIANPNWAENPWNAAHPGGFLKRPGEFFTSPRAIELTKQKYRYIIARWSHSPAVLAWELFNEVHWTNAYSSDGDEAAVAAWHATMAAYIRSIDPYQHLVTTSLEDLRSPIYAAMDYFQPHLYAMNMLSGVRRFEQPFESLDRPVFYGEIGDDKMPVSPAEKAAGTQLVPQVWAGLMGPGPIPAQSWLGESLLSTGRLGELGAVARFLTVTGLASREGLTPFSPAAESDDRIPAHIQPGHEWHRHVPAEVRLPLDGSDAPGAADIPATLVGAPESVADGFPPATTLHLDLKRDVVATVSFHDAGARGATARILVDGGEVGAHTWPRLPRAPTHGPQPPDTPPRPAVLSFPLAAGARALRIENSGGADWVRLGTIDLQLEEPVLAAAGKRDEAFIALWVWNKRGVHAITPPAPSTATLLIEDVPAGSWQVVWWDSLSGTPGPAAAIAHPGGTLRLPTPPVNRHAAVHLTRPRVSSGG